MVRISGLLAAVFGFVGVGLFAMIAMQVVTSESITFLSFVFETSVTSNNVTAAGIIVMLSFVANILMFFMLMFTKKKTFIVASIFGIIANGLFIAAWSFGAQFLQLFANPLMILVALLLFVGGIMMRKESMMVNIVGVLVLLMGLGFRGGFWHAAIIGTLFRSDVLQIAGQDWFESNMNLYLILSVVEGAIYGLFMLMVGFSRVKPKEEEVEDNLSVDQGSAFESKMEEKPKKEKKQKPAKNENVEWKF